MCINLIEIGCEVGGGDGFVISVYVIKKSKRFALKKLVMLNLRVVMYFYGHLLVIMEIKIIQNSQYAVNYSLLYL